MTTDLSIDFRFLKITMFGAPTWSPEALENVLDDAEDRLQLRGSNAWIVISELPKETWEARIRSIPGAAGSVLVSEIGDMDEYMTERIARMAF